MHALYSITLQSAKDESKSVVKVMQLKESFIDERCAFHNKVSSFNIDFASFFLYATECIEQYLLRAYEMVRKESYEKD